MENPGPETERGFGHRTKSLKSGGRCGHRLAVRAGMKVLVFAHKPPPHHGQSYMVQLLLQQLGGDQREAHSLSARPTANASAASAPPPVECYHVDCRLSDDMVDIGRMRPQKLFRLLGYCFEAVWCRLRYRVPNFLHVPAPGLRSALYRDWMVMVFARVFFRRRIYYWQAAGLAEWLHTQARPWERLMTRLLLHGPDLSIVLGQFNRHDGIELGSKRIAYLPNAVPDPCPRFDEELKPQRQARAAARGRLLSESRAPGGAGLGTTVQALLFRLLFMSLCTREKGLFDAVTAVVRLNEKLQGSAVQATLTVAGTFWIEAEKAEFEDVIRPLRTAQGGPMVDYRGFVSGADKALLLRESDCLCFPTYYPAESAPVVLVEAMAFGLPIVTTRWRMLPELMPPDYRWLVDPQAPGQVTAALLGCLRSEYDPALREYFLRHYTLEPFTRDLTAALLSLENPPPPGAR